MELLTLEEVKQKLSDRNLRIVAERTGIGHSTLFHITSGRGKKPHKATLEKLTKYLQ